MAYIGKVPTAVPLSGADIEDGTIQLADLSATGTKDATTFLRGDNTFASAGGTNTPAFEANLSAIQNVSDAVSTKVQFDNEVFDTDNCYDNSTNYRFTPTVAGKYFVYCNVHSNSSSLASMDQAYAYIYKNGSIYAFSNMSFFSNYGTKINVFVTATIDMNGTTDYLEGFGISNVTGGTPKFEATQSRFGAYKIIE